MRLDFVEIKNFRNTEFVKLDYDLRFRGGVSYWFDEIRQLDRHNVLRFLHSSYQPNRKKDLRKPHNDHDEIKEAYIKFAFEFEKDERNRLTESVSSKILTSIDDPDIVSVNERPQKIREFCAEKARGIYNIDIFNERKSPSCFPLEECYNLLAGWKKPASPTSFSLRNQSLQLARYKLIHTADSLGIPDESLADAAIEDFENMYCEAICKITREMLNRQLIFTGKCRC